MPTVFVVVGVPACVTVTVLFGVTPVPAIVTVADLGLVPVLAELDVKVIVPLFVPDTGVTSSQLPSSVILHVVFEVIVNVPLDPEAEPSEILAGLTAKLGVLSEVYVQYMENL